MAQRTSIEVKVVVGRDQRFILITDTQKLLLTHFFFSIEIFLVIL